MKHARANRDTVIGPDDSFLYLYFRRRVFMAHPFEVIPCGLRSTQTEGTNCEVRLTLNAAAMLCLTNMPNIDKSYEDSC